MTVTWQRSNSNLLKVKERVRTGRVKRTEVALKMVVGARRNKLLRTYCSFQHITSVSSLQTMLPDRENIIYWAAAKWRKIPVSCQKYLNWNWNGGNDWKRCRIYARPCVALWVWFSKAEEEGAEQGGVFKLSHPEVLIKDMQFISILF